MKALFTLICSLLFTANIWACSFSPNPFCGNVDSNRILIYGQVIDTIPHGTRVEVLNVYRGVEARDTVTVWNTTDWCMGITSEVTLNEYSSGDTMFFVLPIVDSSIHGWDVVGDYRMVVPYNDVLTLSVVRDSVWGFISGYNIAPPQYNTYVYDFDEFISWLEADGECSELRVVSVNEISELNQVNIYPNPSTDFFTITSLPENAVVELYGTDGRLITTYEEVSGELSVSQLAAGTYTVKISAAGETGFRRIVKL